jgi:hypothetical protein
MLFKEIIVVCSKNPIEHKNKKAEIFIVKRGGTYSYHLSLKG